MSGNENNCGKVAPTDQEFKILAKIYGAMSLETLAPHEQREFSLFVNRMAIQRGFYSAAHADRDLNVLVFDR